MRRLPVLTGVLTVALLGATGWVLLSSGSWLIGSLALGFGVFRLVYLVIQVARVLRDRRESAEHDPEAR